MQRYALVRVWHLGAFNRNIGDWAMAYHMHRMLERQAQARGLALSFRFVDTQRTRFHPGLVDQLNEEADLLLLGGGGLIFQRPEDESVSGWSFNITLRELDRLKTPLVVYGVGYNRFPYDPNDFPKATGEHIRHLQEVAALFSARDEGTKKVMVETWGLDPAKLSIVPDAGIALHDRPIPIPALRKKGPVIAVNFAGDRPHYRYPAPHEETHRRFVAGMKEALLSLVKDLGAQIMFLPHLLQVDSDMYDSFAEGFPSGSIFSTHRELSLLYPPPGEMLYAHVPFFTNIFRQADLVVGMRGHACIIGCGAGTPFMPLGTHVKLSHFVGELGLPDRSVGLEALEGGKTVATKIRACLEDRAYRSAVEGAAQRQIARIEQFNAKVLDAAEARLGAHHGGRP